jgi:hypothetical protein
MIWSNPEMELGSEAVFCYEKPHERCYGVFSVQMR